MPDELSFGIYPSALAPARWRTGTCSRDRGTAVASYAGQHVFDDFVSCGDPACSCGALLPSGRFGDGRSNCLTGVDLFTTVLRRVRYMPVHRYVFYGSRRIAHDGRLRIQIKEGASVVQWLYALDNVVSTAAF